MPAAARSEPLRRLTHGKPGCGKSKLIHKIVRFFEEVMCWKKGLQFHVCTLQAALAAGLGAETCHHVCGINPFARFKVNDSNMDAYTSGESVQTRFLLTRWLLVDEVFMLSAQLFAEMECCVRGAISDTSPYKHSATEARAWGGINLLTFGDMYQLDCPEGTPLYQIPSEFVPDVKRRDEHAGAIRGLDLVWGINEFESLQGVTELTHCFRCDDAWWNEVLDEIRVLKLSSDNHAFLHGEATSVPGSWLAGKPSCGKRGCLALPEQWKKSRESWHARRPAEREQCQKERQSRRRVLSDGGLKLLAEEAHEFTPTAVPNNDVRYEINKLRAQMFAKRRGLQLLWCPAKGRVTIDALREDCSLSSKKKD